jgi:electron-transferring-flavoprotein dehydrogenase
VVNPRGFEKLFPELKPSDIPFESKVTEDETWFLTAKNKINIPAPPPPMINPFHNEHNYVASLQKLVVWMAAKAEEEGVTIAPGYPAAELLFDDNDAVTGVRTTDMGIDHHGAPKGNFQPGMDFTARVTVLGEGTRGTLAKTLIQ